MIRIISILFILFFLTPLVPVVAQQNKPQLTKICTDLKDQIYTTIKPDCKWKQLPDAHPRSDLCSVSCGHKDQKINPSEFPFRLEEVSCGDIKDCNVNPKKCIDEQRESDLESCKEKVKEEWFADSTMSIEQIKAMETGRKNNK